MRHNRRDGPDFAARRLGIPYRWRNSLYQVLSDPEGMLNRLQQFLLEIEWFGSRHYSKLA